MRRMIPVIPVIAGVIALIVLIIVFAGGGDGSSNRSSATAPQAPAIPPEVDQTINLVAQDAGYVQTLGSPQTSAKGVQFAQDALAKPGKVGMTKRGAESLAALITQSHKAAQQAQAKTGRVRTGVTTFVDQEQLLSESSKQLRVLATIHQQWTVRGSSRPDTSTTPLAFIFQPVGGSYQLTALALPRRKTR